MNWNTPYLNHRDYIQLSTHALSDLLVFAKIPAEAKTALDIGCGTGALVRDLYHRGFNVLGIDSAKEAIRIAKESSVIQRGIDFKMLDIEQEKPEGTFSALFCKYVYVFMVDRKAFLAKVISMMDNASTFVILSPNPGLLPENKQDIALPLSTLLDELSEFFEEVSHKEHAGDFWIACTQPKRS